MAVLCRGHDRARRLRLLQSGGGFVLFAHLLLAFTQTEIGVGILLVIALFGGLLTPYLVREIRRGKVELGPHVPIGPSDTHPGRRGNPAPGQPDAQADPYEPEARR